MYSNSQADFQITLRPSASSSLFKQNCDFPGSSPGIPIPQPPIRHGMGSPSTYEDEMRFTCGDRRSNRRYRRSSHPIVERGPEVAWKNGPSWPPPLSNGFIPFQHVPPAPGFAIQHFPSPSLFGAPPCMEMTQSGIPYHMHEVAVWFPGQGHPFRWHQQVDDSSPQMHGWDGGENYFSSGIHGEDLLCCKASEKTVLME